MSFIRAGVAGIAALTVGAITGTPAKAQTYAGKTVTILIGYSMGGTYGKNSLMLARHLPNHLPGAPTIIVKNMPGAGGIKMTNYAANAMPKDGFTIMMPPEMMVVSELLRPKKVKYKTADFTWLGRVVGSNATIVVRRDTNVRSFSDLLKKQVILSASGRGSPTFLIPTMINSLLNTKMKVVTGYRGSAGTTLAMERGESQGVSLMWMAWKANRGAWFKGGEKSFALPIVQSGFSREPDLPNIPTTIELMKTEEHKQIAGLLATASLIGRGLAFPPGVTKSKIDILRKAFDATMNDPVFVADALKRTLEVRPLTGAQIQKSVRKILATPADIVAKARKAIFGK